MAAVRRVWIATRGPDPAHDLICRWATDLRVHDPVSLTGGPRLAARVLGSYDLSHRCFDDGNVLVRRAAAYSDAGDYLVFAGERHAAAHRGVSAAGDRELRIELRAWLHEGD
jgi:hypothetical protein